MLHLCSSGLRPRAQVQCYHSPVTDTTSPRTGAPNVHAADLTLPVEPGVDLALTTFSPADPPTRVVIVSSGTGYARRFYRGLAEDLCARGAYVVTYDFRGVAESATPDLLRVADLPDWGRDLDAVIRHAHALHPGLPIGHIGHSAGGHIVAFSAEAHRVQKHVFVAVGAGTLWQHFVSRWPLELYFWWILGPLSLARHGHLARGGGWGGAPLPAPVFRTWRRWSHRDRYYAADVDAWRTTHAVPSPTHPIESWVFTDDGISTPRAARTILACFPDAPTALHLVAPADIDRPRIDHDGAFRKKSVLWNRWWDALCSSSL